MLGPIHRLYLDPNKIWKNLQVCFKLKETSNAIIYKFCIKGSLTSKGFALRLQSPKSHVGSAQSCDLAPFLEIGAIVKNI